MFFEHNVRRDWLTEIYFVEPIQFEILSSEFVALNVKKVIIGDSAFPRQYTLLCKEVVRSYASLVVNIRYLIYTSCFWIAKFVCGIAIKNSLCHVIVSLNVTECEADIFVVLGSQWLLWRQMPYVSGNIYQYCGLSSSLSANSLENVCVLFLFVVDRVQYCLHESQYMKSFPDKDIFLLLWYAGGLPRFR